MKIKCIDARNFKNLTLNKVYDVIEEVEGFYKLNNDAEVDMKYSKDYFESAEKPVVPPKPVAPEDKIVVTRESNRCTVTVNGKATVFSVVSGTAGSCGLTSLHGLNSLWEIIGHDPVKFEKAILAIMNEYNGKYAMIIFSTNNNAAIWEIMDRISDIASEAHTNPNSSGLIKTWIKYTN